MIGSRRFAHALLDAAVKLCARGIAAVLMSSPEVMRRASRRYSLRKHRKAMTPHIPRKAHLQGLERRVAASRMQ